MAVKTKKTPQLHRKNTLLQLSALVIETYVPAILAITKEVLKQLYFSLPAKNLSSIDRTEIFSSMQLCVSALLRLQLHIK